MRRNKHRTLDNQGATMGMQWIKPQRPTIMIGIACLIGLYIAKNHNYLLFHSLSEFFSIIIAFCLFLITWNTRENLKDSFLLIIGLSFFYIGLLDLFHTLAYKGMGVFTGRDANLPTQLWIAARYFESLAFTIALLLNQRTVSAHAVMLINGAISAALLSAIFIFNIFPDCYVAGVGLTTFKRVSEYLICLILVAAICLLCKKKHDFDNTVHGTLLLALFATIASELAFTFYIGVYDLSNLIGHLWKIVAFYLIYLAIVETGFTRPYQTLFRQLSTESTSRRQIAQRLETNEARYRNLFENISNGLAVYQAVDDGRDFIVVDFNRAGEQMDQINREALLGRRVTEVFPAIEKFGLLAIFRKVYQTGQPQCFPVSQYADQRLTGWRENYVFKLPSGEIASAYSDETEKVLALDDLLRTRNRYKVLFKSLTEAVFIYDVQPDGTPGKFIEINPVACERLGYSGMELKQMSLLDIMPSKIAKTGVADMLQDIKSHGFSRNQSTQITKDGRVIPVENQTRRFKLENQALLITVSRDISEQKRLEILLRQSQKMEAIGTLAGGIAHDFNNLLSPIIGYAEMLIDDQPDDQESSRSLQEILTAANRSKELVKQILAFSRKTDSEHKPLRINLIAGEVIKLLRASIPSTIDIRFDIQTETDMIMGDPSQIQQVLMNLCTNAYHAMQNTGGCLTITLSHVMITPRDDLILALLKPGSYVRLTVSDSGEGIPGDRLERIFEPYYTTKPKGKGTGLGLSIVHAIIKNHQGEIAVESQPGQGTMFTAFFPLITLPEDGQDIASAMALPRGTERILLVDDEAAVLGMEKRMLERMGYHVTAMERSLEALECFGENPDAFDLLITDMTMPVMTGEKMAQRIRQIRSDIPIIICTGFSDTMDEDRARQAGIQAYLLKPIDKGKFAPLVRSVLDARPKPPEADRIEEHVTVYHETVAAYL